MKRKIITWGAIFLVSFFVAMVFKPVPKPNVENTYELIDTVQKVFEGPSYDIVFNLESKKGFPYINRGLQNGLDLQQLKEKLEGKKVKFKFVNHWTPLDYNKSSPTVAYIELESTGEIIYNNITS